MKVSILLKISSIGIIALSMLGCKKLLKEYNPSGVTAEAVYTTPAGFETLVNASYSYLRWWYGKEEGYSMSEMGTDIWTSGEQGFNAASGTSNEGRSLVLYDNLQGTNGTVDRTWRQLYAAVNLCNTGIKIYEDEGRPETKRKRVAELKFLRAFYYWHIVETWGSVHLTTEPTTEVTLTANRTPVEEFYKLIMSDLEFAELNLDPSSSDLSRITIPVAKAFLARVYLTKAYKDASYFERAREKAKEVINNHGFILEPSYKNLWIMNRPSKEVIWTVNYSTNLAISDNYTRINYPSGYTYEVFAGGSQDQGNRASNNGHLFFTNRYDQTTTGTFLGFITAALQWPLQRDVNYGTSFNRYMPTKFLLFDAFNDPKDLRYNGSFQTVWLANRAVTASSAPKKFALNDTALVVTKEAKTSSKYYVFDASTLFNPGTGATILFARNLLYPNLTKFRDSTRSLTPNNPKETGAGQVQSSRDVFVFRLAEMHMIIAEAETNLGNVAQAADQVNILRKRAGATDAASGDMTIDYILDERAREFAGEQIRWFDLKRTNKLVERVRKYNPDSKISDIHVVRPIPRTQLDVVTNKSEFTQNFGYN